MRLGLTCMIIACSATEVSNGASAVESAENVTTLTTTVRVSRVHAFDGPNDGGNPRAPLIEVAGRLYGTAYHQGPLAELGCNSSASAGTDAEKKRCPGTVFSVGLDGTDYRIEHAFSPVDDLFRNADGYQPAAALALGSDGRIRGTAWRGGVGGGVVFSFLPTDSVGSWRIERHNAAPIGHWSFGSIVEVDGARYGVTKNGGASNRGVLFRLGDTGALHSFSEAEGIQEPTGAPVLGPDGRLYGATRGGGAHKRGVWYSVDPVSGTARVEYDFPDFVWTGNVDNTPYQSPVAASDGCLYYARALGGVNGSGMISRLCPRSSGADVSTIYSFDAATVSTTPGVAHYSNATGALPMGSLAEGTDGLLYGTTFYGGTAGTGVVYRLARDGSMFQVLYDFAKLPAPLGARPAAGLVLGSDGAWYGTTRTGGGNGAIFRLELN